MSENRVRTPTGRVDTQLGNPPGRPAGPTQHLIPVGPPATYAGQPVDNIPELTLERSARGQRARLPRQTMTSPIAVVGFPRLDSPIIDSVGTPEIPWARFLSNLWRFVQPTGIVPGAYAGITFNAYGQAISATTSGITFDSVTLNNATINNVTLTGSVTAPTPPANDNSNAVATTAWVQEQGYATEGFVTGQNYATQSYVQTYVGNALVPYATQAWVRSQGYITDAPRDGHIYGRQNGLWVLVPGSP